MSMSVDKVYKTHPLCVSQNMVVHTEIMVINISVHIVRHI